MLKCVKCDEEAEHVFEGSTYCEGCLKEAKQKDKKPKITTAETPIKWEPIKKP
jgi:hypothetical protein